MILSEIKLNNSKYKPRLNGKPIKTQKIYIKCDDCGKEYNSQYLYWEKAFNKHGKDLCRGCKQKIQYADGLRDKQKEHIAQYATNNQKGKTLEELYGDRSLEIKRIISKKLSGKNNPNYGGKYSHGFAEDYLNPVGKTYEELYGKEKANKMKNNLSILNSGSKNKMYGKPSPQGSGNGWSGWYKGWYFRSLIELSYMVNVIEKNGWQWVDAEAKKYKIPYVKDGIKRNYFGDFIVNNEEFIEIKPRKLRNSERVLLKEEAGIKWCKEHNLIYNIVCDDEFDKLADSEIDRMVSQGIIKFIDRYQRKYDDRKKV
jgi:hypothetical protein